MKKLHVLFDSTCGFCCRCHHWMAAQPKLLEVEFVTQQWAAMCGKFPTLPLHGQEELIVVSDEGGVYRGPNAFLMCLYALEEYRKWSLRLARPALLPLARQAFALLSKNRHTLSHLINAENDENLRALLETNPHLTCAVGKEGCR